MLNTEEHSIVAEKYMQLYKQIDQDIEKENKLGQKHFYNALEAVIKNYGINNQDIEVHDNSMLSIKQLMHFLPKEQDPKDFFQQLIMITNDDLENIELVKAVIIFYKYKKSLSNEQIQEILIDPGEFANTLFRSIGESNNAKLLCALRDLDLVPDWKSLSEEQIVSSIFAIDDSKGFGVPKEIYALSIEMLGGEYEHYSSGDLESFEQILQF